MAANPKGRLAGPRDAMELNLQQLMKQETPLLKFGMSGKPGFRNFQLSSDLTSLNWTSKNKSAAQTKVNIKDIKEIRYGQRTEKFKRNNRADLDALSFSIIYLDSSVGSGVQTDSLDLVCKDELEFQVWTTTLAALVEGKIDVSLYAQTGSGSSGSGVSEPASRRKSARLKLRDVLKEANDIYCWGSNAWGEAGIANKEPQISAPKLVDTMLGKHVVQLAIGWSHSIAVLEDGSMMTYGNRIGTGLTDDSFIPSPVTLAVKEKVEYVACGAFHSAVVTDKCTLLTWGCGFNGQLGHGTRADSTTPKVVEAFTKGVEPQSIISVACGANFTMALTDEGQVYTWGANEHGQCGHNHTDDLLAPQPVRDLTGIEIMRLACGHSHALAATDREVYAWGLNSSGQLGLGHEEDVNRPHAVESLRGMEIRDLACGAAHSFGLVFQSKLGFDLLYAWGSNQKGQCGNAKKVNILKPSVVDVRMNPENPFKEVKCGAFHSLARQADGTVWTTGCNSAGQLGHGGQDDEFELKVVDFLVGKNARGLCAGGQSSAALTSRTWLEDSEATDCMSCHAPFTFTNRKHHCRNCGGIFCMKCSSKKIAILKFGLTEPVRVCDSCYSMLGGR